MRFTRTAVLMLVLAICSVAAPRAADATQPPYLILQGTAATRTSHHNPTPAYGLPVQRYTYGWFGARSRRQCSWHHGYYSHFTQITVR